MPVVFKCTCGCYLSVSRKNIGKRVVCPECEEIQHIPNPKATRSVRLTQQESRRLRRGDVDEAKQMVRKRFEEEKKEKKKKKRTLEVPEDSAFESAILEAEGISINCFCGTQAIVSANLAGKSTECMDCGRQLSVPDPSALEMIELAPIDDGDEKCPFCGSHVSPSELKCHSCGKNLAATRKYDA